MARFEVNDVVTTVASVVIKNAKGKSDGRAMPGWEWRITRVSSLDRGAGPVVRYYVTANKAPNMYFACLTEKQIANKVGEHRG